MKIIPFSEALESAKWDEGFEAVSMDSAAYAAPATRILFSALWQWIDANRRQIACRWLGHAYVGETHYPDSGHEVIGCTRCGISHTYWH